MVGRGGETCDESMAATSDADMVHGFIKLRDLESLQAFTPRSFDWTQPLGKDGLFALICVLNYNVAACKDVAVRSQCLKIAEWLLRVGADARQKLPVENTCRWSVWKNSKNTITVECGGHSAASMAFAWLEKLEAANEDWAKTYLKDFLALVARFNASRGSECAEVTVPQSTLVLWESMRDLTTSHNVIFQSSDGEVSAHDQILMLASPVLKAMLASDMKEGSSLRIEIEDSSSSGVSLFLDLLYTSSTREDPDHKTMLVALDLAHRWQVHGVVQTLCNTLRDMIDASTFVDIAEAASLKGLERLERACAQFGSQDEQVQGMLQNGSLPAAVRKLLGETASAASGKQDTMKKRRIFC